MDSPQPFLMEISPQPAPALDSILKLSGCGHLPPFEGCPSWPRREAWLRPGWFRIDPIFRGPTVGGQSCHPYPTPTGWTLPGEGLCQGSTAAVTKAELQGPPSSISHQRGCWAGGISHQRGCWAGALLPSISHQRRWWAGALLPRRPTGMALPSSSITKPSVPSLFRRIQALQSPLQRNTAGSLVTSAFMPFTFLLPVPVDGFAQCPQA